VDLPVSVSIIMAAYNAAGTISDALESLCAQTRADWDAIIVNDGSGDDTGEIARSFAARDSRLRVVDRTNGGESAARNTGLGYATGDWVAFLDADDWVAPTYLERLTDALRADAGLDAVHCAWVRVAGDGACVSEAYRPPTGDLFPILARRAAFAVHACLVRRALVEQVGGFDVGLKTSPDWDLWQRIARSGANFGSVPEVLAYYRMSPNSASLDAAQVFRDGLTVIRRAATRDPRVPNPRPEYADGLQDANLPQQQYYLLCWCAGVLLGSGREALSLLDWLGPERYPDLDARAVAECIFNAGVLPSCATSEIWESLLPKIAGPVGDFLAALEEKAGASCLAARALSELTAMTLRTSAAWSSYFAEIDAELAELKQSNASFVEAAEWLEADRERWRRRADRAHAAAVAAEAQAEEASARAAQRERESSALRCAINESLARQGEAEQRVRGLQASLRRASQKLESLENHHVELLRQVNEAGLRLLHSGAADAARLNLELAEARDRAEKAEAKNLTLQHTLAAWQLVSTHRAVMIEDLQRDRWMRLGIRLGVTKRREVVLAAPPGVPEAPDSEGAEDASKLWRLHVAENAEAHIVYPGENHALVRIEILKASPSSIWSIQLNRSGFRVTAGLTYVIEFDARAQRPRSIAVGVAKGCEPWSNLGYYEEAPLGPEWQRRSQEFIALEDDDNARVHFDLAREKAGVELVFRHLKRLDEEPIRFSTTPLGVMVND
jgi:glycosyltransferase involved in cell wall biosynthesis